MNVRWDYMQTEPGLWTVGFTRPDTGRWEPESDHDDEHEAGARVEELNGDAIRPCVYMRTEPRLWTVGHFFERGWHSYSDHSSSADAARETMEQNS